MDNSLNAARVVAYTGAIVTAIPFTGDWKIAIPFVGIAIIEFVLIAHKLVDMARGKLPVTIVDAAEEGRLLIDIDED